MLLLWNIRKSGMLSCIHQGVAAILFCTFGLSTTMQTLSAILIYYFYTNTLTICMRTQSEKVKHNYFVELLLLHRRIAPSYYAIFRLTICSSNNIKIVGCTIFWTALLTIKFIKYASIYWCNCRSIASKRWQCALLFCYVEEEHSNLLPSK